MKGDVWALWSGYICGVCVLKGNRAHIKDERSYLCQKLVDESST